MDRSRRGWMWRLALAGAALAVAFLLPSGCVATTPTPEPVTISFAYWSSYSGHYEELVSVFTEQYPHITVELRPLRSQAQYGRLERGENLPDTFEVPPSFFAALHEGGHLWDLRPYVEGDDAFDWPDFYPSLRDLVNRDGTIAAIPSAVDPGVILYNRDLFDRYGVAYPEAGWTWQDFVEVGIGLTDYDSKVYGFAPQMLDPMYLPYAPHYMDPLYFVYQNGGRIFDNWNNPTRTTFDDPLTVEAVEWYARLIHEYGIAPTRTEASAAFAGDPRGVYGYILDKVGMMYAGASDRFPRPGQDRGVNQGVVIPPRGTQSATFCVAAVYAVSARSEHPEASWQWISFLSTQMPTESMPPRQSLAASDAYEDAAGAEVAAAARAAMESDEIHAFYLDERRLEALEAFNDAVYAVCEGAMTAAEALGQAQQASKLQ